MDFLSGKRQREWGEWGREGGGETGGERGAGGLLGQPAGRFKERLGLGETERLRRETEIQRDRKTEQTIKPDQLKYKDKSVNKQNWG